MSYGDPGDQNVHPPTDMGPLFDAHHDGETYEPALDKERLNAQQQRVFDAIKDGEWRTLYAIAQKTGDPETSVSARLRDLRKPKFGGYEVERRRDGATHYYRLVR